MPPLAASPELTADFKVADDSLAGFVQDESKVFSTTIRPMHEGITHIPAIQFSFFNPETEAFETVASNPIPITVKPSETLSLDAIVGNAKQPSSSPDVASAAIPPDAPDFSNNTSTSLLKSQNLRVDSSWWWTLIVGPPTMWLIVFLVRYRAQVLAWMPFRRSARQHALRAIDCAESGEAVAKALAQYLAHRCGNPSLSAQQAIGVLRVRGLITYANEVESFQNYASRRPIDIAREQAEQLLERLDQELALARNRGRVLPGAANAMRRSLGMLVLSLSAAAGGNAIATETLLSEAQQTALFSEANTQYAQALQKKGTEPATAKELFQSSAEKYQWIVDSGVSNSGLFANLANAYLQSGQLGRSIVYYERARQLNPDDHQVVQNLKFATARVQSQSNELDRATGDSLSTWRRKLYRVNAWAIDVIGVMVIRWILAGASVAFWGLLILRTLGFRFPWWQLATIPALILLVALMSTWLTATDPAKRLNAVVVANTISIHAGDGEHFDQVATLESAQGQRLELLTTRGRWSQVRAQNGQTGWVKSQSVVAVWP
ncbi:MAG: hypothetical protein R3C53_15340 [Pirellulaceae bacterium]